jgi:hypothetical protein
MKPSAHIRIAWCGVNSWLTQPGEFSAFASNLRLQFVEKNCVAFAKGLRECGRVHSSQLSVEGISS